MNVAWVADTRPGLGGAEVATAALEKARPHGVTIRRCVPDTLYEGDLDAVVIHNIASFRAPDLVPWLNQCRNRRIPIIKYVHDLWPHGERHNREWILSNADLLIFTSKQHRDVFSREVAKRQLLKSRCIPPPADLETCRTADAMSIKEPGSYVWLGRLYEGKGVFNLVRHVRKTGIDVDVYGMGPDVRHVAKAPGLTYKGPLQHSQVPSVLAHYENFIFLPDWLEPCGLSVIEAWACGCKLHLNDNVGAREWIESPRPGALETAADDFWHVVGDLA